MFLARCLVAVAVLAVPALASAEPPHAASPAKAPGKPARTARIQKSEGRSCNKPTVEVTSGADTATFSLARCDGTPAPLAVDQLSILARPGSAAKPKQPLEALAKTKGSDVAPGIRRVDPRLVERLELAVEHFRKTGQAAKVQLISGVRPRSAGSYHQSGRALDFRIDGVTNEALVAFCKTLDDTGCGYYPNSLFVHMDVREHGAGHVAWIDALPQAFSGPPSEPGLAGYVVTIIDSTDTFHDGVLGPSSTADDRFLGYLTGGEQCSSNQQCLQLYGPNAICNADTLIGESVCSLTGVGRGQLRLYVDAIGEIQGHTWSPNPLSTFYPRPSPLPTPGGNFSGEDIVVGRYTSH